MCDYESARVGRFSCPACGGRMVFDPADQQLKCPYCGTLKTFPNDRETPNLYDIRFAPPKEDAAWDDETRVVRCEKCGAELVLTGETELKACPFCGKESVAESDSGNGIAPDSLVPFQIAKKEAQERFRAWTRPRLFACWPLRRLAASGKLAAIYLAHWMYADDATSAYQGKSGRHYEADLPYNVMDSDGKERTETHKEQLTRWEAASGILNEHFDDVLIPAGDRLPDDLINGVLPYHMSRITRYTPEFIAGYACEKPTADVQEGWKQARGMVDRRMASLAERSILAGADEAKVQQLQTEHENVRYRLVLLPMYLGTYTYRKKLRSVLVNGDTGKVNGQAPVSPLKVGAAVLVVLLLLFGLIWLFMSRGGSEYMLYDFN